MIFAPTELDHIDFNGLLKFADPLRAALQVHQHGPSAELTSVSDNNNNNNIVLQRSTRVDIELVNRLQ